MERRKSMSTSAFLSKTSVSGLVASPVVADAPSSFEERRWPYYLLYPFCLALTLWVMAKKCIRRILGLGASHVNSFFVDGISEECRDVRKNAKSWRALERIYNYQFGKDAGLIGRINDFWQGTMNPQALRNRLKVAKSELRRVISTFRGQEEVRIMSLAAGSARGVIEVVAELKASRGEGCVTSCGHRSYCSGVRSESGPSLGVEDQVQVTATNANFVAKVARRFQPHIIEMMGLLDYLPQKSAIRLAEKIKESLPTGGYFLTCNIYPNIERTFLKWVLDWPMIYRTRKSLTDVVVQAGFSDHVLVDEPLNIHGIVVARKS